MKNRKGFTLIELLAVIVILGILMLIAIPLVTKYIDSSKKEVYVKTVSNMVDVVRYGVLSETSKYNMGNKNTRKFNLTGVELEKGSNKSPYGNLDENYSYVVVTKVDNGYNYEVQVKDDGGYCIELIDIDDLDKSKIVKCDDSKMEAYSKSYKIGDKIEFVGSNWYVIKDSTVDDDYVTLLKDVPLTNAELGKYGIDYLCTESDVTGKNYGCTSAGQVIEYNSMAYYYSDACHISGIYGYTKWDISGCKNHNDYEESKVKEFLEGTYMSALGSDNLKEVYGYKVRLITVDELRNNLRWTSGAVHAEGNDVPQWVYSYRYITMTPVVDINNYDVYGVCSEVIHGSQIFNWYCYSNFAGRIRPVINLLKSSI